MTSRLTMPQHVSRRAPVGSLLKRPRESSRTKTANRGRVLDPGYLALIRELPCLKCGMEPCGEAAHVRLNSASFGKRQALGQKPSDSWTVPLCAGCHRDDPDAQHKVGEAIFWDTLGINPLLVCQDLQKAAVDVMKMRAVIFNFIAGRE